MSSVNNWGLSCTYGASGNVSGIDIKKEGTNQEFMIHVEIGVNMEPAITFTSRQKKIIQPRSTPLMERVDFSVSRTKVFESHYKDDVKLSHVLGEQVEDFIVTIETRMDPVYGEICEIKRGNPAIQAAPTLTLPKLPPVTEPKLTLPKLPPAAAPALTLPKLPPVARPMVGEPFENLKLLSVDEVKQRLADATKKLSEISQRWENAPRGTRGLINLPQEMRPLSQTILNCQDELARRGVRWNSPFKFSELMENIQTIPQTKSKSLESLDNFELLDILSAESQKLEEVNNRWRLAATNAPQELENLGAQKETLQRSIHDIRKILLGRGISAQNLNHYTKLKV